MYTRKELWARGVCATLLLAAACGGNGAPAEEPEETRNVIPSVEVHQPAADLEADVGAPVEIRYTDADPDDDAESFLTAVPEGGGAPVEIAAARPEQDGVEQIVIWDTAGVAPGRYRIQVLCRDPEAETRVDAAGFVTLHEVIPPPAPAWIDAKDSFLRDLAVLPDGDVVCVGQFSLTATFGEGQANEVTLLNPMPPAFRAEVGWVARYAEDGTLRWVRPIYPNVAPARNVIAYSVAAFADGSCVVAGRASYATLFNVGLPSETELPVNSTHFLARYDADGAILWVEGFSDIPDPALTGWAPTVEAVPDGSCVVSCVFHKSATFRNGRADQTTLDVDPAALLAARYAADGTLQNVIRVADAAAADPEALVDNGLASFADGSFAVTGEFRATATFSPGTAGETTWTAAGTDGFAARYDAAGDLVWLRRATAAAGESARFLSAAPAPAGALLVSGAFGTGVTISPGADQLELTGAGAMFVSRFDADGALAWAHAIDNVPPSFGDHLACDAGGNCVVVGRHDATVDFWEGASTLPNALGGTAAWTGRFLADGTLDWTRSDGGGGSIASILQVAALRNGGQPVVGTNLLGAFTLDKDLPTELTFTGPRILVASFSALGQLE